MKLKILTITLLLLFCSHYAFNAQKTDTPPLTIEQQFDILYRKSSSYRQYKVVSKKKYNQLKLSVSDSINALKTKISQREKQLTLQKAEIKKIKETLRKTSGNLEVSISKEKSISFFGTTLSKTTYNLILWSIVVILLTSLGYFIFKFFKSNEITKIARKNLIDAEKDFEIRGKKSLAREQKLRRKLQDEINKQRNS